MWIEWEPKKPPYLSIRNQYQETSACVNMGHTDLQKYLHKICSVV